MRRGHQLPISQYGFLSDSRSSALVGVDGQIDWLCWPRFDSQALCSHLLDAEVGGCWWMRPAGDFQSYQSYETDSLILQTHFSAPDGEVRVTDWLHTGSRQTLCRLVEGVRGEVVMDTGCDVRNHWGLDGPQLWADRLGYLVADLDDAERLVLDGFTIDESSMERVDGEMGMTQPRVRWKVRAGETHGFTLGYRRPGPSDLRSALRTAREYWSVWASGLEIPPSEYQGIARHSAIVLKGLQYQPSGAFIAAPTTSLPESPGGSRNWDYRFSWIRDAAFTVDALNLCGKRSLADSWVDWLTSLSMVTGIDHIQIMYGVEGETDLEEYELPLAGYEGAKPVRVGNGAVDQRQLDTYGELLQALLFHRQRGSTPTSSRRARYASALADTVIRFWREPDQGIWEVRSEPRHYVHSKVMAWVALDRAVQLAELDPHHFDSESVQEWSTVAEEIRKEIHHRGAPEGWFQAAYDLPQADAANLQLGLVGFIEPSHPVYVETVRRIQSELSNKHGMILRYESFGDGIDEGEHSFVMCTLWLVLALQAIGDHTAARDLFNQVCEFSSSLGLFAEQLDDNGRHWGNYPQAFTHIAIIQCAFALTEGEPVNDQPAGE